MSSYRNSYDHAIYKGHIVGREVLWDSSRFESGNFVAKNGTESKYKNNPSLEARIDEVTTYLKSLKKHIYGRYFKLVDPATGKDVVSIVPCHDMTMKSPVAFLFDTKYRFYEMVSLVLDEDLLKRRFTNDPGYEVNLVYFIFTTCFESEYEYVCGGIKGARLKEEKDLGLFTFGIESVIICRLWTRPKARTHSLTYRFNTYHLEDPSQPWYHPLGDDEETGDDGYMTFVHAIVGRVYQIHTVPPEKRREVMS